MASTVNRLVNTVQECNLLKIGIKTADIKFSIPESHAFVHLARTTIQDYTLCHYVARAKRIKEINKGDHLVL